MGFFADVRQSDCGAAAFGHHGFVAGRVLCSGAHRAAAACGGVCALRVAQSGGVSGAGFGGFYWAGEKLACVQR